VWLLARGPSMNGFIQRGLLQFAKEVLAHQHNLEPELRAELVSCAEEVLGRLGAES
jgi:hypothetical protein